MNEAGWLGSANPGVMLSLAEARAGERKSRLLAAAFCRALWDRLGEWASRTAVEVAERRADESATRRDLATARKAARYAVRGLRGSTWKQRAAHAALCCVEVEKMAETAALEAWSSVLAYETPGARQADFLALQAALVREVIGNPFRVGAISPVPRTAAVLTLAQAAYDERALPSGHLDNARLAVISDALEKAGCTDADILSHLRLPGPHVRGCWALDLVLQKW